MTLYDLAQLMRRYMALVVVLPLACALACGGFMLVRGQVGSYSATSYIVTATSAQLQGVNGLASSIARETAGSGYTASVKADTASLTASITVSGPDGAGCVERANAAAADAVEEAEAFYGEGSFTARVERASTASRSSGSSPITYILVALLAGLFLAICIVVAIDALRRPVKGATDLAEASGLPVLEELPAGSGEHLLASVRFAAKRDQIGSICVVPVSEGAPAALAAMVLSRAAATEAPIDSRTRGGSVRVSTCVPVLQGTSAAYDSRRADAAVLAAAQWADSRGDVERAVADLKLAGTNIVGCVLVTGSVKKATRQAAKQAKKQQAAKQSHRGHAR